MNEPIGAKKPPEVNPWVRRVVGRPGLLCQPTQMGNVDDTSDTIRAVACIRFAVRLGLAVT